jgi:hypothetical protein
MDLNNMAENLYKEIVAVIKMPLHNREKFAVSILEVAQMASEEGSKSFMSRTRIYKCRRHFWTFGKFESVKIFFFTLFTMYIFGQKSAKTYGNMK